MKEMVDTQYLDLLIKESGKTKSHLAKKLGCSRQYFTMKCNNKAPFTTNDVCILCKELNVTKLTDKERLFFA